MRPVALGRSACTWLQSYTKVRWGLWPLGRSACTWLQSYTKVRWGLWPLGRSACTWLQSYATVRWGLWPLRRSACSWLQSYAKVRWGLWPLGNLSEITLLWFCGHMHSKGSLRVLKIFWPQVAYHEDMKSVITGGKVGGAYCFWLVRSVFGGMLFYASCNFWTIHARVLIFYIWVPYGKIADPYFFFFLFQRFLVPELSLFSKTRWGEIFLARYLENYLSQGLHIWYTDWEWGVYNLINFKIL